MVWVTWVAVAVLAVALCWAFWPRYRPMYAQRRKNWWCRLGLHRWEFPGGRCEECGEKDRLWE